MSLHGFFSATFLAGSLWGLEGASAEDLQASIRVKVAEMRVANYAADAAAMERLRDTFTDLAARGRAKERAIAHYEAGVASSFLAGFVAPGSLAKPQGDRAAMTRHLEDAARSYEAAILLEPDSADAYAGLANSYGMLTAAAKDPTRAAELARKGKTARERSLALEPRNPRVVLGHAGSLYWAPANAGGDPEKGLARYREAVALFAAGNDPRADLHCWGEPDAWAFLALVYLMRQPPEPVAAKEALDRALELRPDFAWARRALLPAIERALPQPTGAKP